MPAQKGFKLRGVLDSKTGPDGDFFFLLDWESGWVPLRALNSTGSQKMLDDFDGSDGNFQRLSKRSEALEKQNRLYPPNKKHNNKRTTNRRSVRKAKQEFAISRVEGYRTRSAAKVQVRVEWEPSWQSVKKLQGNSLETVKEWVVQIHGVEYWEKVERML